MLPADRVARVMEAVSGRAADGIIGKRGPMSELELDATPPDGFSDLEQQVFALLIDQTEFSLRAATTAINNSYCLVPIGRHAGTDGTRAKVEQSTLPRVDALRDLYTRKAADGVSVTDEENFASDLIADVLVWSAIREGRHPATLAFTATDAAETAVRELEDM